MVQSEEPEEKDQLGQDPPDQPSPLEEETPGSSFPKASETRDSSAATEQPLETEPSEIPKELHSFYEEGLFQKCTICDKDLEHLGLYEVQKVYRDKEVIFETAICQACGEDLSKEMSLESMDAMKGFMLCNFKPTEEPDHCHFCGIPRAIFENYTVIGACRELSLLLPLIIMCEKCSEHLQGELSEKTREVQGNFIRDHFPGVPADLDLSPSVGTLF